MATNLEKVEIKKRNSAIPTKKLIGIGKDGSLDNNYDFFKQSLEGDWWDFLQNVSTPRFNDEDITYSIGIKSTYTCTGTDAELNSRKGEYLKKGVESILNYYGKQYSDQILNQIINDTDPQTGKEISKNVDYHMNGRPSSKLKFLIEIDAQYLNALPDKQPPESFTKNLDSSGNLILLDGLLNPTLGSDGTLQSYDDISVVTLSSARFERELEKTALYMGHIDRDMIMNGFNIRGINLLKEGNRLRNVPIAINSLVSENFSSDGYSAGRNENQNFVRPELRNDEYFIRLAFKENDEGLYEILWASYFTQGQPDKYLINGFQKFLNTNPIDSQTTLRYLFFHQQILNNLDRNIEPNFINFVEGYHYPPVKPAELISQKTKEAPFSTKSGKLSSTPVSDNQQGNYIQDAEPQYNIESDPELTFRVFKKKCGFDFQFPFEPPSFNDLLAQLLQPVNFELGLSISFGSLGPPCPAPFTGNTFAQQIEEAANRLTGKILKSSKVLQQQVAEAKGNIDSTVEYFTSEAYLNDLESRANSTIFKLRQLGDLVYNQFSLDKMLKLVCICLTQIADQSLAEAGVNLQQPAGGMSIKAPGFNFNPALLSDDIGESGNWLQAVGANWGSFNVSPLTEQFSLTQLCSFCLNLPEFLPKFPTFDLLKGLLDLLLALLEALIVQILTALILQLVRWLTQCPDVRCEIRPTSNAPAAEDFGSLDIPDFFPSPSANELVDPANPKPNPPVLSSCPALFGINQIDNIESIQQSLFARISSELSSGELLNVMEGYPTETSLSIIKEIIETEEEFEDIKPFFDSHAKIEEFIDCLSDNADPEKVANVLAAVQDPSYCLTPNNTPLSNLQNKCNNEDQIQRFLLRESSSKAARLKGILDGIRKDPNFFQGLIPDLFSTVDPETNEKKAGLLSADDKFKPAFLDTMLETYSPLVNNINKTARREGASFLNSIYQDGSPNTGIPNDDDLETQSTLQLASAISLYTLGFPQLILPPPANIPGIALTEVGIALSPYNTDNEIDSQYPMVGGLNLRDALETIEENATYSIASNSGNSSKFNGININNKSSRQFNGKVSLNFSTTSIEVYLESITETLKSSADEGGFKNHAIIRLKSPELFQTQNYVGFAYEVPLNFDDDPKLEAIEPIIELDLKSPNQLIGVNASAYSPQGYVFAQLMERGSPNIFNAMIPSRQSEFINKLASSVHLTAFRDLIQSIGLRTIDSPYFTTYVYEDLEEGVGSEGMKTKSFKRFARKDPYSMSPGFPTDDFRQKYRAVDKQGKTSVYWRPVPALEDTPLKHGNYKNGECVIYVDEEEFIEKVKDRYDPFMQYDPNNLDPDNLPPLSNAILDELIPEIIKFYSLDAAIKSMPVSKIYDLKGSDAFRDKMYAGLIAELILKDINNLKIKTRFLNQVTKWWERRYKEDKNLNVADAPVGSEGVRELVLEYIGETTKMASEITDIKHLNESDEKITFPVESFIARGNLSNGLFTVPNLKFNDPQAKFGQPPISEATNYTTVDEIKKGGFIFETFFQVDIHDETKNFVANHLGQEFVDNLVNVPLSFHTLDKTFNNIFPDDSSDEHVLKKFLNFIVSQGESDELPKEIQDSETILGDAGVGLFKEIKLGVRLSYAITGNDAVENFFNDIITVNDAFVSLFEDLAGKGYTEPLKKEIIKNKSFIFTENDNKVLTFPIVTELYDFNNLAFALTSGTVAKNLNLPSVKQLKSLELSVNALGNNPYSLHKFVLAALKDLLPTFVEEPLFSSSIAEMVENINKKPEWKTMFRYCLPEGLASNMVSAYAYLNMIEGLGNTKTFESTKEQLLVFFQSALVKPGMDGKPVGGALQVDENAFTEEDKSPPPLDENGNKTDPEPEDQNNC